MDLSEVNEEVLLNIFDFLDMKDILTVERVCLDWKRIANDEHSWKKRFFNLSNTPYFIPQHVLKQQQQPLPQQNSIPLTPTNSARESLSANNNNNSRDSKVSPRLETKAEGSRKTYQKQVEIFDTPSKGKKGKGKKKKDDWDWETDDIKDIHYPDEIEKKAKRDIITPSLPQTQNTAWYTKHRYRSIMSKAQNIYQCRADITHFGYIKTVGEQIAGVSKESDGNGEGVLVGATCNDIGIFDTRKMTLKHKFFETNGEVPTKKRAVLVKRSKLVYATAHNRVQLYSLVSLKPSTTFIGHNFKVNLINWDVPGMLFTGSHDCTLKLWDTRTGSYAHNYAMLDRPLTMKIIGNSFEAATMDGSYTTIDMRTQEIVKSFSITSKIPLEYLTVDNDDDLWNMNGSIRPTGMKVIGDTIVASISHLDLYKYDLGTGMIQKFTDLKRGEFSSHNFSCVAVSSCVVFAGLHGGIIKGWDISTLKLLYFIKVSLAESVTALSIEEGLNSYSLIYGLSNGFLGVIDFVDNGEDYKLSSPVDSWISLPSKGVSASKYVVTRNYVNKWPIIDEEVDIEIDAF
eukprot:TRINITY_DN3069_c0_g3_i1.p1 TRINITY_DN3069_c0_g3~~TRINITY_DN3069_c0_g3_i1.p1  ORF type:complete len:570 (+),score=102.02 TRINITY_DN3069_c0_g3_i1:103-1812(+)